MELTSPGVATLRRDPDQAATGAGGGGGVLDAVPSRPVANELSLDFQEAIGRLPDGAREVFVLHDMEGYKHDEIADMLGIVPGTSKSQLHHARMALRKHLDR